MAYLILTAREAERRAYIDGKPHLAEIYAALAPETEVEYCL